MGLQQSFKPYYQKHWNLFGLRLNVAVIVLSAAQQEVHVWNAKFQKHGIFIFVLFSSVS
jgi:hypothetical protein